MVLNELSIRLYNSHLSEGFYYIGHMKSSFEKDSFYFHPSERMFKNIIAMNLKNKNLSFLLLTLKYLHF